MIIVKLFSKNNFQNFFYFSSKIHVVTPLSIGFELENSKIEVKTLSGMIIVKLFSKKENLTKI